MKTLTVGDFGQWEILTTHGSVFHADFDHSPKKLTHFYGETVVDYFVVNLLECAAGSRGRFVVSDDSKTKIFVLTTAEISLITPKFKVEL